jgi:hypothetical protein
MVPEAEGCPPKLKGGHDGPKIPRMSKGLFGFGYTAQRLARRWAPAPRPFDIR